MDPALDIASIDLTVFDFIELQILCVGYLLKKRGDFQTREPVSSMIAMDKDFSIGLQAKSRAKTSENTMLLHLSLLVNRVLSCVTLAVWQDWHISSAKEMPRM